MLKVNSMTQAVANDPVKIKAFMAANEAMAELGVAGIIGNICVRRQYLTTAMVQSLSKTCFQILLPMFLCTSIMKTIQSNGGKLTKTTISIPFIAISHCLVVHFISKHIALPLFRMDPASDEGRSTIVSCTFGNSGVIPLIFAEALFRHDQFILQKAYSLVSLYLVGWSPLFWSFGRRSLLGSDKSRGTSSNSDRSDDDGAIETLIDRMKSMKTLFPPPVLGVLFGLIVSSISFIRRLFMEQRAPLGVIYNCLQNLGRAANPLALLVLTASLALGTAKAATATCTSTAASSTSTESLSDIDNSGASILRRLSCVSVVRFIISPIVMSMILNYAFGSIGSGVATANSATHNKDLAMIWFVMILESCMPPAQNSVLMLQVAEKAREASKLAKFLFSMYTTAMLPIVLIATYLLEKCGLTQ